MGTLHEDCGSWDECTNITQKWKYTKKKKTYLKEWYIACPLQSTSTFVLPSSGPFSAVLSFPQSGEI
jgi:hypothetical protein